ncbi:helix-turn-helix transcriptional regulator [Streptomyces sp. NPDC046374]|uniref:helix-turn-helix domain-containing protein n=1 Tax=Streptomyces sp. NPDC046374 TaxID=3154917 RepID=UPI0034073C20
MATPLRFRADVLTKKAQAAGDTTNFLIAVRTGLRESTISRLMAGLTMPTVPTLGAIASAYGMTLDDLVAGLVAAVPAPRTEEAA